jgi:para-nitrobenzyl esterase
MRTRFNRCRLSVGLALLGVLFATAAAAQAPSTPPGAELEGTSWRLVKIEGGDGKTRVPQDASRYLLAFAPHGELSARIDCNRGSGTWSSPQTGQLNFGELASTAAQCEPGTLYDLIIGHWSQVRSYVLRDGHLFLALGTEGVYEYEPLPVPASAAPAAGGAH